MSLLHEIQSSVLEDNSDLGPVLLKLRFLAARLGSDVLEDWVEHEMNGYPGGVPVPDYRVAQISYTGTFSNGFRTLNRISIPEYIIEQHAGEAWLHIDIRDPLSVIDGIVSRRLHGSKDEQRFGIATGNLKLLLEDKVYKGMPMIEMYGEFNPGVFVRIRSTVRAKLLKLTLELEKKVPLAAEIVAGKASDVPKIDVERVSNVTQQLFNYGTVTNVQSSGAHSTINVQVAQGDRDDLIRALTDGGLPVDDAVEFADIVEAEEPDLENNTFGKRAQAWLGNKISKSGAAAWKIGLEVGSELLTKAALKYYGLDS